MKKLFKMSLSIMLISALMLAGCGQSGADSDVETADTPEVTEATEAEQVSETPEEVGAYLDASGVTFLDEGVFDVPFSVVTFDPDEEVPTSYKGVSVEAVGNQMVVVDNVESNVDDQGMVNTVINCVYTETYRINLDNDEYDDSGYFVNSQYTSFDFVDYYTGKTFAYVANDGSEKEPAFHYVVDNDGEKYGIDVSVVETTSSEEGDWQADETDDGRLYEYYEVVYTVNSTINLSYPEEYDGMVLAMSKTNGLEYDNDLDVSESRILFEEDVKGRTSSPSDYVFIRLSDLM